MDFFVVVVEREGTEKFEIIPCVLLLCGKGMLPQIALKQLSSFDFIGEINKLARLSERWG